jgi:hypothetical protein
VYQSVDISEHLTMRQTLPAMSVTRELKHFVRTHRSCGGMSGDAGETTPEGYLVWVACECGGEFERWVTPDMADEDLLWSDLLSSPN